MDFMDKYHLTQAIPKPTMKNTIDFVFTNEIGIFTIIEVTKNYARP